MKRVLITGCMLVLLTFLLGPSAYAQYGVYPETVYPAPIYGGWDEHHVDAHYHPSVAPYGAGYDGSYYSPPVVVSQGYTSYYGGVGPATYFQQGYAPQPVHHGGYSHRPAFSDHRWHLGHFLTHH